MRAGFPCARSLALAAAVCCCPSAVPAAEPAKADEAGFFFPLAGAKDCAYDQKRQRLYVTTPQKLVVVDLKARKALESVELGGTLQACDVAPDFSFLAVAPVAGQYVYRVNLAWDKVADMEISQVKFKADPSETGVFSVAVGADNTTLFSTTFAGSGGVKLRRLAAKADTVEVVGRVNMDTVLSAAAGGREVAAAAQGNISSGPLGVYDFKEKAFKPVADLTGFNYEVACARGGRFFARPTRKGCDLFDAAGGRLGTLDGAPVIAAAFHPTTDALFVLRHGEVNVQEYDIQGSRKVARSYPLDKPLVIRGDVRETVTLQPVGRAAVVASFRTNVNFRTYTSGRLKVADDGRTLFAVVPAGVYSFPVAAAAPAPADTKPRPKIKVVDPS